MKIRIVLLLMLIIVTPLGAKTPTANDVTVAVAALTDATICAVAAFINTPSLELPNTRLHVRNNETLPRLLFFDESDIGTYLPIFLQTKSGNNSFFASLLQSAKGPLNDIAIQYLTVHAWEKGHALLKGIAATEWQDGASLGGMMTSVIASGTIPPLTVVADVLVTGRRVSTDVRIEGTFLLYTDEDGYFTVEPIHLKINGKTMEG